MDEKLSLPALSSFFSLAIFRAMPQLTERPEEVSDSDIQSSFLVLFFLFFSSISFL